MPAEEIFVTVSIGNVERDPIRLHGAGASFTIGSSRKCDIIVDSDDVDVQHVIVTIDADGTMAEIEDATVGNGSKVTVNWASFNGIYRRNVHEGIDIRIGNTVCVTVEPCADCALEPLAAAV